MKTLANPFLALIWRTPALRRGLVTCIVLALASSVAEIAVAISLVPILASLGVATANESEQASDGNANNRPSSPFLRKQIVLIEIDFQTP